MRIPSALLLCASVGASEAATLTDQHADLAINYNSVRDAWQLTIRDEDAAKEYAADRIILEGSIECRVELPDDDRFSFLGEPGEYSWILPSTQEPGMLYLGISTENKAGASGWTSDGVSNDFFIRGVSPGAFTDGQVKLTLLSVNGPGFFSLYTVSPGKDPVVSMNSRDGIDDADFRLLTPNRHSHFNWAFSAPGTYHVTLQASGLLGSSVGTSVSEPTTFTFEIVPEPSGSLLLMSGAALVGAVRRRRIRR